MVSITNYNSGELEIAADGAAAIHLSRDQANRLILAARMHAVEPFLQKLSTLIPDEGLVSTLTKILGSAEGSERWNLKEKFARLHTVAPGYTAENPQQVLETVQLS